MKEEVEAVKINIGLLEFELSVRCESNEDVKILSTALSLAQQWKIRALYLPDDVQADDWRAVTKELGSGKMVNIYVEDGDIVATQLPPPGPPYNNTPSVATGAISSLAS